MVLIKEFFSVYLAFMRIPFSSAVADMFKCGHLKPDYSHIHVCAVILKFWLLAAQGGRSWIYFGLNVSAVWQRVKGVAL